MTDSLALETAALPAKSALPAPPIKPAPGDIQARRRSPRPPPPANHPTTSSASGTIASRLRIGAPDLLARASPATEARFVNLLCRRLGGLLSNAMTVFRFHVGEVATSLDPDQCCKLQDLALTARIGIDDLLPEAVDILSPSELAANLAAACQAHSPDGIDALRCRDMVYGSGNPLAREAMLDLASSGLTDHSQTALEQLVSTHMIKKLEQSPSIAPQTIERLRARCLGVEPADTGSARTTRQTDPSIRQDLLAAMRQGRNLAAAALLASAAGVSRATVEAAICLRTAKGLMSLAWLAGLDAALSVTVQSALGRLPPDQMLLPTANGQYPLTGPEMLWQCRFLDRFHRAFTAD